MVLTVLAATNWAVFVGVAPLTEVRGFHLSLALLGLGRAEARPYNW
jgi:hypothetical protein